MQHTATHCNTLQHTATHCSAAVHKAMFVISIYAGNIPNSQIATKYIV